MQNIFYAALFVFLAGVIFFTGRFIKDKWTLPVRGYTQFSLLIISEITLFCGRGVPCSSCPLSFGICPVGTVQRVAFMKDFPLYFTFALIAAIGLLFGTLTCGWACPIGFIQELFSAAPVRKKRVPGGIKTGRWAGLALIAFLIFLELRFESFSKLGITVLNDVTIFGGTFLLATALFIKKPFCRFLCPLGLIYGKLNKFSLIKVRLNECVKCGECEKVCGSSIQPAQQVNGDLCGKCFNCRIVCNQTKAKRVLTR